ncbi:MAG: pyridoxamine 5-phosphate oxidase [Solirubrobacteraceae bacterium]|nr:pyridoxamine 5-phosphate oxidase [Solirubrobacteraceae bacterium]
MSTGDRPAAEHLASMRGSYARDGLDERDVAATWLEQLRGWLADAERHGILEPNAMVLATAGEGCAPAARTVLLKGLDERGLVFHTNYESRKGRQLEANPRASVVFPWLALHRQVLVDGVTERIAAGDSDAYWASRPRGSQLGAAASAQSQVIGSRAEIEAAVAALDERYAGEPIPRPPHWGGVLLVPHSVEFWQGRADRLHDRLRFRCEAGAWVLERLAP